MITPAMELEADLGIDSIKRVEILSAVRERAPGLPELDPAALGALRTVGEIVDHLRKALGASAPAQTPTAPATTTAVAASLPAASSVDLQATMLAVVAEKTGYPAEMITPAMELEADLGIDSIKRVEILSAVRERAPGLPELDPAALGALRTVGEIVDHLEKALGAGGVDGREVRATSALSALSPSLGERAGPAAASGLRWVLRAVPRPACGLVQPGLAGAEDVVVMGAPLAGAVAAALVERGVRARAAETVDATTDAVVYLGALAPLDARAPVEQALAIAKHAFQLARALAPRLGAKDATGATGAFVVVQDTGGDFGLAGSERAWLGGLTGLVKTARQEWPRAAVRAIDLEGGASADPALAARLADELVGGGPEAEVGLRRDGTRVVLESVARDAPRGAPVIGRGDVVVVSGGARGVTAACTIELVRRTGARAVLLGRSTLDEEPVELASVSGDAALKRAVLELEKARGRTLTPPELGKRVERILASREIRGTIEACRRAGGDAEYLAVDVQDGVGVAVALEPIRAKWGPVRALVHGAGVIADRFIADKTDEQWSRVMETKVLGLRALLEATKDDPLAAIVMFSSVAGRTGNVGQCDYATANEILNKVAAAEAARRRALDQAVVVRSLGWGPWEGGMVTPALKARFEKLGVRLIGIAEGAGWMCDELAPLELGDVEIVLGGEPKAEALLAEGGVKSEALEARIQGSSHPFVDSHRVQGAPVLPAVTALDLFVRAARALRPSLHVREVRDLAVLKGIRLARYDGADGSRAAGPGDRFLVMAEPTAEDEHVLAMQIVGLTTGRLPLKHYAAKVVLGPTRAPERARTLDLGALRAVEDTIYDGLVLFHGPLLHAIEAIEGESERGIRGTLLGRDALGWPSDAGAPTDGALLDGALQLAVYRTKHTHEGASLPTSIARYVPGVPARGPVQCTALAVDGRSRDKARFDIELADAEGTLVARIEGLEVFVRPGSREQLALRQAPAEAE
jgi:NADP-dependent 3-hydroxy acid dehydrogenase YdfG/acyl carrier protein